MIIKELSVVSETLCSDMNIMTEEEVGHDITDRQWLMVKNFVENLSDPVGGSLFGDCESLIENDIADNVEGNHEGHEGNHEGNHEGL